MVTPTAAKQIATSYWAKSEQTNVTDDPSLLPEIESGPALTFDQALLELEAKINIHLTRPRPLRRVVAYVPHQSQYPAEFVVRFDTVATDVQGNPISTPVTFFNLFEKPSAAAPWKSTIYAVPDPSETVAIAIANDGYARKVSTGDRNEAVQPAKLPEVVANYLNAAAGTDVVANQQLDDTSVFDASLNGLKQQVAQFQQTGVALVFRTGPGEGGTHSYLSEQGGAITFFALSSYMILAPIAPGGCIAQNQQNRFSPEIPPGSYGRITADEVSQLIADDSPRAHGKAKVVGLVSIPYGWQTFAVPGPCVAGLPTRV